jgi:hypothetical protein
MLQHVFLIFHALTNTNPAVDQQMKRGGCPDKPDKDPKPPEKSKPEKEKSDQDPKPTTIDEEVIIDASKIDIHVHSPGECISADIIPTISPKSIENDIGYYAFTDVETGYLLIYPMRNKTSESFIQALTSVIRFFKRHGIDVKYLRIDRGSNLISDQVDAFLAENRIIGQSSPAYAQYQNRVEREVQTINKSISAIITNQPWIRLDVWNEALNFFRQTHNLDNLNILLVN